MYYAYPSWGQPRFACSLQQLTHGEACIRNCFFSALPGIQSGGTAGCPASGEHGGGSFFNAAGNTRFGYTGAVGGAAFSYNVETSGLREVALPVPRPWLFLRNAHRLKSESATTPSMRHSRSISGSNASKRSRRAFGGAAVYRSTRRSKRNSGA